MKGRRLRQIATPLLMLTGLVLVLAPSIAGCQPAERTVSEFEYSIDARGRKSVDVPGTYFLSPDRTRFAYYEYGDDRTQCVVVGKSEGKHYGSVNYFIFSPDGKRFAYVANGNTVVVDGVEGKTYSRLATSDLGYGRMADPLKFSPDSKHVAYVALTPAGPGQLARWVVVVDGVEQKPYETILDPTYRRLGPEALYGSPSLGSRPGVMFSPDGGRTAYVAQWWDASGWMKNTAVVDGVEGTTYDQVHSITFSNDGRRVAYVAGRRNTSGWTEYCVVLDGVEGPWYQALMVLGLAFSADKNTLAYAVVQLPPGQNQRQTFAVVGGVQQPAHWEVREITFSPIGAHLAYVAQDLDSGDVVVLDGTAGKPYYTLGWHVRDSGGLKFSPNGERLAYVIATNQGRRLVVDGVEGPEYSSITDVTVGADSQHVAYLANGNVVVIDGVETPYNGIKGKPVFSPDARRSAAIVTVGGSGPAAVAVDGVAGTSYSSMSSLVFSPNGQHFAYVARDDKGKSFVVVDGVEGKKYDKIMERDEPIPPGTYQDPTEAVVFDSDRQFHYLALFDDRLYLVRGSVK